MRQDGQSRNSAQAQIGHECRRNQNAITKAMHAVAGQDSPLTADFLFVVMAMRVSMVVRFVIVVMDMAMLVPVVPQFSLVEQKEKHQTDEQGQKQFVGPGFTFKSFRQQMQKSRGQQCPSGQAQHVLGVAAEHTKAQPGGQPNAANARHQSAHQNCQ